MWSKFSLLGLIKQAVTRARRGPSSQLHPCLFASALTPESADTNSSSSFVIQPPPHKWKFKPPGDGARAVTNGAMPEPALFYFNLATEMPRNLRRFCPLGATGGRCKSYFLIRIRPWHFCCVCAIHMHALGLSPLCGAHQQSGHKCAP